MPDVNLIDLKPGDRVLRPFYKTEETVVSVEPRTPRARDYFCVRFESGHEWTNHKHYQMEAI